MPRFRSVIFDCDSTLSRVEGIELLATAHRDEVARLTAAAMRGEIPLEDVYARRLALVRPTRADVNALGRRYVEALVPDAAATVAALRAEGIEVRIISGGLRPAVLALARTLGVAASSVAAVDVYFDDETGAYAGFDDASPLTRSGGKEIAITRWRPAPPRPVMLVGDGVTDLEARPAVDLFVAFAGVVARAPVVERADVVLRAPSLAPIVPLALGGEPPRSPAACAMYARGTALLDAHDATPSAVLSTQRRADDARDDG